MMEKDSVLIITPFENALRTSARLNPYEYDGSVLLFCAALVRGYVGSFHVRKRE